MTKVDIISGFLGAGKTTLIKKLLAGPLKGQQVVLIENEFGEIGIDGGFLKDAGIEIREMNSGCICCSLVGDFGTALVEVIEKYHPDRIIIEPSGVGKLSDVIHAVEGIEKDILLNSATTVVDVIKCKLFAKNFGEFFKNQIESASTVILSRMDTDKATDDKVETALEIIKELNPEATVITTPVEQLEGKKLLDTMEGVKIDLTKMEAEHDENCTCGCHDHDHDHHNHHHDHDHHEHDHHDHDHHDHDHHHDHHECGCGGHDHDHDHDHDHHDHDHHHECGCGGHDHDHNHDHHHDHHHADEVFTSWGVETIKKYTEDNISSILESLSDQERFGMVLRAKGMVSGEDDHWIYFDMVPEEIDIREGSPEYTGRICVIGAELNEVNLKELFGV